MLSYPSAAVTSQSEDVNKLELLASRVSDQVPKKKLRLFVILSNDLCN